MPKEIVFNFPLYITKYIECFFFSELNSGSVWLRSTFGQPPDKRRRMNLLSFCPWRKHKLTDADADKWQARHSESQKYASCPGTWAS